MSSFISSAWDWLLSSGLLWYLVAFLLVSILGRKSQIHEWAEANPKLAGLLKILRGVGFDPWIIIQGLYLLVSKKLPPGLKPPEQVNNDTEANPKLH